ncbi:MAG: exonuclease SbcCD subunit D [Burkholderiales bacterium]
MRLIHTADWHIGRHFFNINLVEDQAHVLDQFIALVRDARPDVVLVSGDIYDRAVPPADAVRLLDDILSRIVIGLRVPVVLIAGNHDSPDRLGFGARLLAAHGLHVAGPLSADPLHAIRNDADGPVHVYGLPYAEPAVGRNCLGREDLTDHNRLMYALVERVKASHPAGERSVVLAHAFVAGGEGCDSERALTVGGSGAVDVACFEGFSYVALGHLHRPQAMVNGRIQYPGSLLKYSFSEASHVKSVNLVEMDGTGICKVERVHLTPRRDVRAIKGTLQELLGAAPSEADRDDYLQVMLLDKGPVLDAMARLQTVYPNALHIERPERLPEASTSSTAAEQRRLSDLDLFSTFFAHATGDQLSPDEAKIFVEVAEGLRRRDRESGT